MFLRLFALTLFLSINAYPDSNTEGLDLSDEDRRMLNDYSSDSYNQKAMDELCDADSESSHVTSLKDACKGNSVKTWGIDEQAIGAISKAYSTFAIGTSLMGGSSGAANGVSGQSTGGASPTGGKKNNFDYCGVIGAGTEMVSGYQQDQYQKYLSGLPTNAQNAQTEGLIKVKKQYREKAKNQELNSIGWSSTSLCYVGRAITGSTIDVQTAIKIGASATLGVYNGMSAADHRALAKELNVVIQKMPQNGDCNPITETYCFCNLPENLNNEKYCMPQIRARAQRQYGTQVACLDKFGRPDGDCSCISRNDCFDVTYMSNIDGISFGKSAEEANGQIVSQVAKGTLGKSNRLESGNLSNKAISKLKRALKKIGTMQVEGLNPLSPNQKKEAQSFYKLGIPKNIAAALAGAPKGNAQSIAAIKGKFSQPRSSWRNKHQKRKSRIQSFNNARGFSIGSNKQNSKRSNRYNIKSMLKKPGSGKSSRSGKVQRYANRARNKASISTRKGISIFKIISRRYQLTKDSRLK